MKYWRIAPGEKGFLWEEQRKANCIALGWNDIGPLNKFRSDDELIKKFKKLQKGGVFRSTGHEQLIQFYRDVNIGDKVIASAKKDKEKSANIYGIGTITGDYKFNKRLEYRHSKPVKWEITFQNNHPIDVTNLKLSEKIKNTGR